MRLLILSDRIPPENRGGAGQVTWLLARGLHAAGHDVHVVAATDGPPFREIRDGIPTYHLHSRYRERWRAYLSLYNPQTVPALQRLYADLRPDVINAHNIHRDLSYHSLTLARRMGIPAVFSSHDVMPFAYHKLSHFIDPANPAACDVPPEAYRLPPGYNLRQMRLRYNPVRNRRIRHVLTHHAAARTAVSAALATVHAANDLPPFTVVHNGVRVEDWATAPPGTDALRDRLDLADKRVILVAGRLTGAKGTRQLLDALPAVIETVPDLMLLVLSAAPIDAQIAPQDAALRPHIRGGGWLAGDDLAAAFHLADGVVSPSVVFDSFPTVNLEAMATGTPVITTCFGGAAEAVIDGLTGAVINPYDTPTFAARLRDLLQDDALRQRMGQAAQDHVRHHFRLDQQVQAMVALYETVAR